MCPCGGIIPKRLLPSEIVCHCLLIEIKNDLVLIDTGLGDQDIKNPKNLGIMSNILGINPNRARSALEHVKALGFSPSDVTHIIPTHLDFDHAGGVVDFPNAQVHVTQKEYNAAFNSYSLRHLQRYNKLKSMIDVNWNTFDSFNGENWYGFKSVRNLNGLPPEILLVPLFGHTDGQVGVAVYTEGKWLLHCGDAYYDRNEISGEATPSLGWKLLQKLSSSDYELVMNNQKRLAKLYESNASEIDIFCAHDVNEYNTFR